MASSFLFFFWRLSLLFRFFWYLNGEDFEELAHVWLLLLGLGGNSFLGEMEHTD
jgi:hypothetical protein